MSFTLQPEYVPSVDEPTRSLTNASVDESANTPTHISTITFYQNIEAAKAIGHYVPWEHENGA